MAKTERLDLRLTTDQKLTIEKAATIEGTTAAGFTVTAVMERASEAIYRTISLRLPASAWDEFVRVLDARPAVPQKVLDLLATPSVLES